MNLYVNIWDAGYVKGSVYRQGFGTHRLGNSFPKSWKNSKCLWRGQTICRSCCKGPHLLDCVCHSGFVPESSFLGGTGDCCVSQVCTLHSDPSHRSECHTRVSHTPAPGHHYCHLERSEIPPKRTVPVSAINNQFSCVSFSGRRNGPLSIVRWL